MLSNPPVQAPDIRPSLLSAEQEKRLIRQMRQGGITGEAARHQLVESNQGLVYKIAGRYASAGQKVGLDYDDLAQEGFIGLLGAIDRFDLERDCRLSTYATWWIRQAISRAIQEHESSIHIPSHLSEKYRQLRRVAQQLAQQLNRQPTCTELAHRTGWPEALVQEVSDLQRLMHSFSLEKPQNEADSDALLLEDTLADPDEDTEQKAVAQASSDTVFQRLQKAGLSARERLVLELHYGFAGREYTQEEISHKLNLSRERVRQIEAKALGKLRRPYAVQKLSA